MANATEVLMFVMPFIFSCLECTLGEEIVCCETKRKIADSLLLVLNEKPLRKVTVKDIMNCENMNRQTFYYHFQDIYEVIEWMFREDFITNLAYDEEETIEEWVEKAFDMIKENRGFYKRILESINRERVLVYIEPVIEEQIEHRLKDCEVNEVLKEFVVRSVCHNILDGIEGDSKLNKEKIQIVVAGIKTLLRSCQENLYTF